MKIKLKDVASNKLIDALILPANSSDMLTEKEGWKFNWKQVYKSPLGAPVFGNTENKKEDMFYKVVLKEKTDEVQGLLKVSIKEQEMVFMDNLEVSPSNYGSKGKYDYVAGVLIAFACNLSYRHGKGSYYGYLLFDSKTQLIDYYKNEYGATRAFGQRMFFAPETGKELIKQYLKRK